MESKIQGFDLLHIKGLSGPTVKHLFVFAGRHMIPVGVELPNQAEGLEDQLKKRAWLDKPC
jgi:hypothetical protein